MVAPMCTATPRAMSICRSEGPVASSKLSVRTPTGRPSHTSREASTDANPLPGSSSASRAHGWGRSSADRKRAVPHFPRNADTLAFTHAFFEMSEAARLLGRRQQQAAHATALDETDRGVLCNRRCLEPVSEHGAECQTLARRSGAGRVRRHVQRLNAPHKVVLRGHRAVASGVQLGKNGHTDHRSRP